MSGQRILAASVTIGFLLALLSGCSGDTGEPLFMRRAEGQFVGRFGEHDVQWWQDNKDRVLAEARAACTWLEARPELEDGEYQDSSALVLRYLRESDMMSALTDSRRVGRTLVGRAWAYQCIETRNSRTSLPAGVIDSED